MKISILTPSLSHNCLGRAYLLAKVLHRQFNIEIVGPILESGIWGPVAHDDTISYKVINICDDETFYSQALKIHKAIEGQIIYASKPLPASFGAGLLIKLRSGKQLVLDIDDWEMGFLKENKLTQARLSEQAFVSYNFIYRSMTNLISFCSYSMLEKFRLFADAITVSNSFLQTRYGGTMVYHGRDTDFFDPEKYNNKYLRAKYGINTQAKVVMFAGTPRTNKGINELIKAVSLINDPNVCLVVTGVDLDADCKSLVQTGIKMLGERFKTFGRQDFTLIPEFIAMADIMVMPQKRNFATIGQTPAKVFDAMAMAKPIIATNVSDLPEILADCGKVIEPDDPIQLGECIQNLIDHPVEANLMGQRARKKCIEKYSWDVMEKTLVDVFSKFD